MPKEVKESWEKQYKEVRRQGNDWPGEVKIIGKGISRKIAKYLGQMKGMSELYNGEQWAACKKKMKTRCGTGIMYS